MDDRLVDTEQLRALEERVAALEAHLAQPGPTPTPPAASEPDDDVFWALEGLRKRVPEPGAVMLVGSVQTPGGVEARWQVGTMTEDFFDSDFADRAESLSALAHPVRLRILQRVMTDAATVQDLVNTEEFGTTGQIYHHLKQLVSAGWLRSTGRGRYEVPVHRVVPLLGILQGAH
ncbi:MAG: ArsR/SmtB family transcription factor [Nesterenkonia sp.]